MTDERNEDEALADAIDAAHLDRIGDWLGALWSRALFEQEQRRVAGLLTDQAEAIMPPEALAHGEYAEVTIVAEDRSQATVMRRRSASGLVRLHENGKITDEQFLAATNIVRVIEKIGSDVSVRGSALKARIDNSSGNRNDILEHIGRIRDEVAYSKWRRRIPMPKKMVLDMLLVDRSLAATARVYKISWTKARSILVDALELWIQLRDDAEKLVDEDEVRTAIYRLLTLENGKGI